MGKSKIFFISIIVILITAGLFYFIIKEKKSRPASIKDNINNPSGFTRQNIRALKAAQVAESSGTIVSTRSSLPVVSGSAAEPETYELTDAPSPVETVIRVREPKTGTIQKPSSTIVDTINTINEINDINRQNKRK